MNASSWAWACFSCSATTAASPILKAWEVAHSSIANSWSCLEMTSDKYLRSCLMLQSIFCRCPIFLTHWAMPPVATLQTIAFPMSLFVNVLAAPLIHQMQVHCWDCSTWAQSYGQTSWCQGQHLSAAAAQTPERCTTSQSNNGIKQELRRTSSQPCCTERHCRNTWTPGTNTRGSETRIWRMADRVRHLHENRWNSHKWE